MNESAAVTGQETTGPNVVTRFAPSPTGALHLGHALSAVTAHAFARSANGRFLLRIEDIDGARSRPEHVDGILRDLEWLGLTWDGPVVFQSERLDLYEAALARLARTGPALSLLVHPRRDRGRSQRAAWRRGHGLSRHVPRAERRRGALLLAARHGAGGGGGRAADVAGSRADRGRRSRAIRRRGAGAQGCAVVLSSGGHRR